MTEIEELSNELALQQTQIEVLTELCVALLRRKSYVARANVLEEFTYGCGALAAAIDDGSDGSDQLVRELRDLYTAICARFHNCMLSGEPDVDCSH